jgi:acetamidase/formamidase
MIHEIPLERRTLHGHFSRDLQPILSIDSGDTIVFPCLASRWHVAPRQKYEPRHAELDEGHPLVGPVEVRGARAGQTLEVQIDALRVGDFGFTATPGDDYTLEWQLDADALLARDERGRGVELRPFLGVMGMPPAEPGVHSTGPPRKTGGNIDCKELVVGTKLFLPISVDGALFSAGDPHARQGDGEVSGTAIECPLERAELTLSVREDLELRSPIAWSPDAWLAFGFGADLGEAVDIALASMLELMQRELGFDEREALAFASVVVDLRVTQIVNGVNGIHAVLPHGAIG